MTHQEDVTPTKKKSKGLSLLDDFLTKVDHSLKIMEKKGVITLEELQPAWEAREKLEDHLSPARDNKGHFIKRKENN